MSIILDNSLRLEKITLHHTADLFAAVDANRNHLSVFLSWVGAMQSEEDMANYIRHCELLEQQGLEKSFVVLEKDTVVGRVGLHYINQQHKHAAIGYWLTQKAQGRGIMLKSCKAVIQYGFEQLELERIEIKAAVENNRSRSIPERLGFVQEGILRKTELVNNKFIDMVVYAILKEEWIGFISH